MADHLHPTLQKWHQYFDTREPQILNEILAEDAAFHSPVVHTPQRGKKVTSIYLSSALSLLAGLGTDHNFVYVNEVLGEKHFHLEFEVTLDDVHINGMDMIEINDEGKIINFKVMIRPLQAINHIHKKMGEMLAAASKN